MVNDIIADMLTRIRNANLEKHQIVQVPATKITSSIVTVLRSEGFIQNFEEIKEGYKPYLLISLKYQGAKNFPVITELKRISKPGLRVYSKYTSLPKVLDGLGIAIISTSKGIMSDRKARHAGLGGEILCYIW
uniref:Small ribosomal subunit protein uS8c n=1 Tax=Hildenbrandia rubra TaxID=31481 RepID=A0A1C9CGB4_9FLOR|nr:ribosomal protein S8 [Hildenbrandia rubra]AOM67421.1 ribosomal protein S8 [Hildenbrandia rubra]